MKSQICTTVSVLAMMLLAACGESLPPEPCGIVPQQTVHVGETGTVAVCFNDADGQEFTLSARSSDDGVVSVRTQLFALVIEGVDIGSAVIMVTATDPDGNTGELSFAVDVPNREPTGSIIAPVTLTQPTPKAELILTEYFTDPDAHPLTFAARSSDPEIVAATVTGSILTLQAESNGSASVRVIATDPYDLSAEETIEISVRLPVTLLRDDFDDPGLDGWQVSNRELVGVENGRLRISTAGDIVEGVDAVFSQPAEDWVYSANVEATSDGVWPALFAVVDDETFYGALIGGNIQRVNPSGPRTNLIVVRISPGGATTQAGWYGLYDEIKGPGEAMDVALSVDSTFMNVTVDGTLIHSVDLLVDSPSTPIVAVILGGWWELGTGEDERSGIAYVDWVQVDGLPVLGEPSSRMEKTIRLSTLPTAIRIKK